MGWFDRFTAWMESHLGVGGDVITRALSVVLVVVAYVVARRGAARLTARTFDDPATRYQIGKVSGYVFGVIALAVLAKILLPSMTGLATYLGLLSAGLAVSLQDPLINLAGWLFIVIRRPFSVGDRIQIGANSGDVVDIRIFQFVLLEIGNWVNADQSTGRLIYMPNGIVFKQPQANYDQGFSYIWNEIAVVVTFESDWRHAKEVLARIVNDHAEHLTKDAERQIAEAAERFHIKFAKLTPFVWTSVVDDGVRLTMRYLCKPRERRSSQHEMWEAILDEFATLPDVEFAYRTVRTFDNFAEGKPEARSSMVGTPPPSDAGAGAGGRAGATEEPIRRA